jgi:biopolymer transport protein ExbB/TolQ
MKRIRVFKAYFVLWTFIYFIAYANKEVFVEFFLSTLAFNIVIVTLLAIGTFMLLRASKDLSMLAGTFGVLMYKKDNLDFYTNTLEHILPSTIAYKIKSRLKNNSLLFTQQESDDILNWMDEKFSNQNRYNNFFIGTVLMIGLLGTFAGLLGAIGGMSNIISSLIGTNIDISSVMSGFSQPMSAMAVGFSSSLFGVVSSIILSIKGYILNKNQAAILDGVENWIHSKTLESVDESGTRVVPSNNLDSRQQSFVDLFIESIKHMSDQINTLTTTNKELQTSLITTLIKSNEELQRSLVNSILNSNREILSTVTNRLDSIDIEQNKKFISLQDSLNLSVNNTDMILNNIKTTSSENKLDMFNISEALTTLNRNIKVNKDTDTKGKHNKTEEIDFLQKHFNISNSHKEAL